MWRSRQASSHRPRWIQAARRPGREVWRCGVRWDHRPRAGSGMASRGHVRRGVHAKGLEDVAAGELVQRLWAASGADQDDVALAAVLHVGAWGPAQGHAGEEVGGGGAKVADGATAGSRMRAVSGRVGVAAGVAAGVADAAVDVAVVDAAAVAIAELEERRHLAETGGVGEQVPDLDLAQRRVAKEWRKVSTVSSGIMPAPGG